MNKRRLTTLVIAILSIGGYTAFAQTPAPNMSFFDVLLRDQLKGAIKGTGSGRSKEIES